MQRNSFVFYKSFFDALVDLNDDDRLACFDAICKYALFGDEPDEKGVASAILKMARPSIDRNNERYENGCRGGRPKKTESKPNTNQARTNEEPYVYEYDYEYAYEDKKKNTRFKKPTVDDVREYCRQRGNHVNAEKFVAHYESNGWKVGKNPMKNWKSAVITWEKRDEESRKMQDIKPVKQTAFNSFENQHEYNFTELAAILAKPVAK